jgi:flavin-dependent dehydrogenase
MIARLCDEERWIGERIFGGAAAIPLRRPYTRQSAPGLALLGDAGAQVFSAHGSGIAIGLRAAKLLAQTIIAAPRSRLGDGDVLHRYAAGFHRDHGAILDGYDVVRRLSQSLEKRESEALIAAGLITPSSARAALAQALPPLSPRELPAIVRGFARAPRLAAKLGLALARLPLLAAHASAYPDAPDVHALAAFESRRAHLLGVPRDPVV